MHRPVVSVVIPAYNSEKFVGEAIRSVLSQTYQNVECIVVNDGSTDNTSGVVRGFGGRVLLVDQENRKLPEARNTGIRHASGEYISFLDADDRIAPEKIQHQLSFLQSNPEYGAVYSAVRYFADDAPEEFYSLRRPSPQGDILRSLVYGNFIPVHSTLIRKELVDAVGGFRPFRALEDWDLLLRLAVHGCRFGYLDEVCADYRMHAGGMSVDSILMLDAKLQVIKDLAGSSTSVLKLSGIDAEAVVAYHLADFGKALVCHGKAKEGVAAILKGVRLPIRNRAQFFLFAAAASLLGPRLVTKIYQLTLPQRKREPAKQAF